jgi:hypothetical protein
MKMTVLRDNGNPNDFSIGIIAVSRHQDALRDGIHRPLTGDVSRVPTAYQDIGYGCTRAARGPLPYKHIGHTAVIARIGGVITFARGFVPQRVNEINIANQQAVMGVIQEVRDWDGVVGAWHDDIAMLEDPTCISYEIHVSQIVATSLPLWFRFRRYVPRNIDYLIYSLLHGRGNSAFNCVGAALTLITEYLDEQLERGRITQNVFEDFLGLVGVDTNQGHLIRRMLQG